MFFTNEEIIPNESIDIEQIDYDENVATQIS